MQKGVLPEGFLAISDNGAGDYYGFPVVDGSAVDEVQVFDHETGTVRKRADGFLDFARSTAFTDEG